MALSPFFVGFTDELIKTAAKAPPAPSGAERAREAGRRLAPHARRFAGGAALGALAQKLIAPESTWGESARTGAAFSAGGMGGEALARHMGMRGAGRGILGALGSILAMRAVRKHEKRAEDIIPGGKADNKTNADFNPKQLAMGKKVEMEHTDNPAMAQEIARDHLEEFPNYYTALDEMEAQLKAQKEQRKVATVLDLLKAANDEESGPEEKEENSPSKPLPPEIRAKIEEFIRTHDIKNDRDFHEFVESLGVSAHDAEPIVYQMAHRAS